MEIDDDVLFADLTKQIALLIMDDDEYSQADCPAGSSVQAFPHICQGTTPPPHFGYGQMYARESKGTGVFIPRSSIPRRKNRARKFAAVNTGSYRQLDKGNEFPTEATKRSSNYYRR